ncbi:MAG: glycosyltransferase family 39 protein [Phycisphaerales bacterium]|nr:MAG: glycosyltransferase family 39 protein [Phycisphaerales bacterium]
MRPSAKSASQRPTTAPVAAPFEHRFRPRWSHAALIFLLALTYRGIYITEAARQPDFNVFYMDQEYHLGWARALASGNWTPPFDQLKDTPYFRAPLYPYFLALGLRVGGGTLAPRIIQIVIGALSCALAYAVATKCFGRPVGLLAGVLCSLYWVLAYFDAEFLLPVLLVCLLLAALLLLFLAAERRNIRLAAIAGLIFGLYAITRPNILVFYPFAWWWCLRTMQQPPRLRSLFTLLFALGCLLPPAAVTVRNRLVGGDWVVVASQGGVNFYIGNNPQSNGVQAVVPGTRQTWWGGFEDARNIAQQDLGRPLKPSEISRYWFARAFTYIHDQPGPWLKLTARKILAFIGDVELSNNEPYEARRARYYTLRAVPLSFAIVFALFLVGLPQLLWTRSYLSGLDPDEARLRARFASLLLQLMLIYSLSVIAFFVTGRYRVPLLPLFIMGAALTLVTLFRLVKARRPAPALVTVVVALALFAPLRPDYLGARRESRGFVQLTDAQDLLEAGHADAAVRLLEQIRADQSVRAPEVYRTLARAYLQRNRPNDKELLLQVALEGSRLYPQEPELLWYVALYHADTGRWAAAAEPIERYLALRPDDLRGLYLAFQASLRLGQTTEAAEHLSRAESLDPQHPLVPKMRSMLPPDHP